MNDVRMSTDAVAERERLAYWRDAVCDTFVELECESSRPARFFGSLTSRQAGGIQYSEVRSAPQHVARTRHKISQSGHDYFLLSLQTSGQGVLEQDGRTAILRVYDAPGLRCIVFQRERRMLDDADTVAIRLQTRVDPLPTRTVNEPPVNEHDVH